MDDKTKRALEKKFHEAAAQFKRDLRTAIERYGFVVESIGKGEDLCREETVYTLTRGGITHPVKVRIKHFFGTGHYGNHTGLVYVQCWDVSPRRTLNPSVRYKDGHRYETPVDPVNVAKVLEKAFCQMVARDANNAESRKIEAVHAAVAQRVDEAAGQFVTFHKWSDRPQLRLGDLDEHEMVALVRLLKRADMLSVLQSPVLGERR